MMPLRCVSSGGFHSTRMVDELTGLTSTSRGSPGTEYTTVAEEDKLVDPSWVSGIYAGHTIKKEH